MPSTAQLRLAAAACSRRTGALASLPSLSLTAYASAGNVLILDNRTNIIQAVLPAHSTSVTALSIIANNLSICVLAASADGDVSAWKASANNLSSWSLFEQWSAHKKQPCVALAVTQLSTGTMCVTAGMEGGLASWHCLEGDKQWQRVADAEVAEQSVVLLECIALRAMSTKTVLLAAAGTDPRIWLFSAAVGEGAHIRPAGIISGHRDWVRGLAFSPESVKGAAFYMATASKDGTARVWHVSRNAEDDKSDEFGLHTARVSAQIADEEWSFAAAALLDEHTGAVHSVAFEAEPLAATPRLITSSMDCSVALWCCGLNKRWECVARFGLMGGTSAHALGFFGATFATPRGDQVLGHNFGGALHSWRAQDVVKAVGGGIVSEFVAKPAPGGHSAPVTDLAWDPKGRYLLSCSADKTARIFAEVKEGEVERFVEWARPQMHGHAIFAVAFCDEEGRKYVSGAEERMLRVFDAPMSFALPGRTGLMKASGKNDQSATSAVVPELGLSNKATFGDDQNPISTESEVTSADAKNDYEVKSFGADRAKSTVPLEEDLKQRRLWPETAKLYGHGNEISCIAANLATRVIASACRAQVAKDAHVILWDSESGLECGRLSCHDLTVNEMCFNDDGRFLMSVSRDRSFAIFRRLGNDNRFAFSLIHHRKSAHSRLIYSCTWILGNTHIATGGRDKFMKIFALFESDKETVSEEVFKQKFESPVTSIDSVLHPTENNCSILAAGFDSGHVRVISVTLAGDHSVATRDLFSTSEESRCGGRVNSVQWRPMLRNTSDEPMRLHLALACEDQSTRIIELHFDGVVV